MLRFNLFIAEYQAQALGHARELTGLSASEVLRRMLDHCCQPEAFNTLFPQASGSSHQLFRRGA